MMCINQDKPIINYAISLIKQIHHPTNLSISNIDDQANDYCVELDPLSPGFGHTLGNALRRILLSYIAGSAITSVEIDGILHEYSRKSGIKEDILEILHNLQNLTLILNSVSPTILTLNKKGLGVVTAADLIYDVDGVKLINPHHYICTITDPNITLQMKLIAKMGIGYQRVSYYNPPSTSFINIHEDKVINYFPITTNSIINQQTTTPSSDSDITSKELLLDVNFNPIKQITYTVQPAIKGHYAGLDKLCLFIHTNGTIKIEEAIHYAATILIDQLEVFTDLRKLLSYNKNNDLTLIPNPNPYLIQSIDALNLPVRAVNCLKNENINYIGSLVQFNENELMKMPNLGKKSLNEIKSILDNNGLALGMNLTNWPPMSLTPPVASKQDILNHFKYSKTIKNTKSLKSKADKVNKNKKPQVN